MTNEQLLIENQEEPTRTNEQQETEPVKRERLRLLPIWLRVILVVLLFVILIALGLIIGYSVIGDGTALDVFKWETWKHILDIINGVEE